MGGHHGPQITKVPDWRIYRVEDVPQLVKLQKNLAQLGLRDPWLRNEVWKYQEHFNKHSFLQVLSKIIFKGFKYGATAGVITAAVEYAFFPLRKPLSEMEGGHH